MPRKRADELLATIPGATLREVLGDGQTSPPIQIRIGMVVNYVVIQDDNIVTLTTSQARLLCEHLLRIVP